MRSTKGQHKALDLDDQPAGPKKRGGSPRRPRNPRRRSSAASAVPRSRKGTRPEPWILCDKCNAWQHNVCMGVSVYSEDIPKDYFCEQCRPLNHHELLDGIARGEKPWEERRRQYEEEKASNEKKRKGGRKGKKRASDPKEEASQASQKAKASPAPEQKKETRPLPGARERQRRRRKGTRR